MVVRGDNFDELLAKIKNLRLINGHPIGDPEKDVLRYYAEHFPYMVKSGDEDGKPIAPSNYFKWRDWIRYMWYDPPKKLLTRTEAADRWEVCKTCPHNVAKNWKTDEEADEFNRRAFMLRAGLDVPSFLGYCDHHRWDLGLAVFLPEPSKVSHPEKRANKNQKCWVISDGVLK